MPFKFIKLHIYKDTPCQLKEKKHKFAVNAEMMFVEQWLVKFSYDSYFTKLISLWPFCHK